MLLSNYFIHSNKVVYFILRSWLAGQTEAIQWSSSDEETERPPAVVPEPKRPRRSPRKDKLKKDTGPVLKKLQEQAEVLVILHFNTPVEYVMVCIVSLSDLSCLVLSCLSCPALQFQSQC